MAIHNARDNSFKLIFGNHELFAQFLRDFVPIDILKHVTAEDIQDESERLVPLSQDSRDSDTLKRVHLKSGGEPLFVIAVLEHESKVNFRISFKMLQYICLVLNRFEEEADRECPGLSRTRDFRYPPVLPIVFYDGAEKWTAQRNFAERTWMNEVFAKYIPGFEYELVALNRYSLEDVMSFGDTLSVIMAVDKLPKEGGGAELEKLKEYVSTLNIPGDLRKLIGDVLAVLLDRLGAAEERITAVTDTIEKREEKHMFDQLVEGLLEEKRLAQEQTRAEDEEKAYRHLLESARKLKTKGLSDEDIAESLSLPEEVVAAL
jgi:predicted transposase/invertase (TIGR01784 family)